MKTITNTSIALLLFLAISVSAQPSQEYDPLKGSTLVSSVGSTTVVDVVYNSQPFQMEFTVKENSGEKGLVVDYSAAEAKGTIYMSKNAVKEAVSIDYSLSGDKINLDDITLVWVSQKVYNNLQEKGEAKISTDGGSNWKVIKRKYYNHDFSVKTKAGMQTDIAYMYCETDDGATKFWIQTGENPLILKLEYGIAVMTTSQFKMQGE